MVQIPCAKLSEAMLRGYRYQVLGSAQEVKGDFMKDILTHKRHKFYPPFLLSVYIIPQKFFCDKEGEFTRDPQNTVVAYRCLP